MISATTWLNWCRRIFRARPSQERRVAQQGRLDGLVVNEGCAGIKKQNKVLIKAVLAGDGKEVVAALAARANVDTHDASGFCALESASGRGNTEIVRILLFSGADVHADDDAALDWTVYHGHAEVVRIPLSAGANVYADDDAPLREAARNGHIGIARLLLAAGADSVAAWLVASEFARTKTAATLDACADTVTPAQGAAAAEKSDCFVKLRAVVTSANHPQCLRR